MHKIKAESYTLLLLIFLFSAGCEDSPQEQPSSTIAEANDGLLFSIKKVKVELNDGLYIESPDTNDVFYYNTDNKLFVTPNYFKYSYSYIKDGDTLYCSLKSRGDDLDWEFLDRENANDSTLFFVNITPLPFSDALDYDPKQTIINIDYLGEKQNLVIGGAKTGIVENHKNIWMHPPRNFLFKILELNPFPYIQAPYEVGNTWSGELSIGSFWRDVRWKSWEGSIMNKYSYKIIDRTKININDAVLNCFVVEGKAVSQLGPTKLISWVHPDHGFVKMDYENIDGSQLILERVWN